MRFLKHIWIFHIAIGLITLSESTIVSNHSSPKGITAVVGDTLKFRWTSDKNILFVDWGVRISSSVNRQYIYVDVNEAPRINAALDDSLKRRLFYVGNMTAGLAWFNITNANVSDSKTYVAEIREQDSSAQFYYVQVIVESKSTPGPSTPSAPFSVNGTVAQSTTTAASSLPNATTTTTPPSSTAWSAGKIAGVSAGCLCGCALICGAGIGGRYYYKKKQKSSHADKKQETEMNA